MHNFLLYCLAALGSVASGQDLRTDPKTFGPALEVVHLYYGQWPTGIAVSKSGRKFSNFPAGLDANNTNTVNGRFAVAELLENNTEVPYPSKEINSPPGGAINMTSTPPTSVNFQDYFVGVQSVVIDSKDRLWVLDTGRVIDPASGLLLTSLFGGPKLVGIDLETDTIFKTITFPTDVVYPDSYPNDVRFDLNPNLSRAGSEGVAYITDSSTEGRNGLIIVDLESGRSHRHLTGDPRVKPEEQFVPFVWGKPLYAYMPGFPRQYIPFGSDGIALSASGKYLYFSAVSSRTLYKVDTSRLRDNKPQSEIRASASVRAMTQKGVTDGMETDSNSILYMGNMEQEAIVAVNPRDHRVSTFVRDPRINWVDTMAVGFDGYLYFTVNQLNFIPLIYPGTDRRIHPYVLFRAKLPNGGTKVTSEMKIMDY